jgi:hypothetical protein
MTDKEKKYYPQWLCEKCRREFTDDELDINWKHNEESLCPICHTGTYLVEIEQPKEVHHD